jgi:hypothetical protein
MKPLHITLLAVGATLAGGLAFEMTQAPVIPIPAAPFSIAQNPIMPPSKVPPPLHNAQSLQAPAAIAVKAEKPSPIPKLAPPVAEAPAPVYIEKAKAEKARPLVIPASTKAPSVLAKASPAKTPPTQWTPTPYEAPAPSASTEQKLEVPAASASPAETPLPEPHPAPASAAIAQPRHVTLRTGMTVAVRLDESLSSERALPGDIFQASLTEPLVVDNLVIAERGARATGRIVEAARGSRIGAPALLELALTSVMTSDGQRVALSTDPWAREGYRADDPIGAIFSRPKPATAPTFTVIRFRLASRVTVTEQLASR